MTDSITDLPGSRAESPIYRSTAGVGALLAGQLTLYFDRLPADSSGLVAAYRRVMGLVGPHLTWFRTESQRGSEPIRPKDLEALPLWFAPSAKPRSEYEIVAGSGQGVGEVGEWGFYFAVERGTLPQVQGHFQFHVPAQWLASEGREAFAALVEAVSGDFAWTWGNAGFAVAFDAGELDQRRDAAIHAYVMRYLGVECHDLITETELPPGLIKGVNWLTFVDRSIAEAAGLGPQAPAEPLQLWPQPNGGVLLRAGERPLLGDRNRQADLSAYAAANRLLRSVCTPNIFPLPGFQDEDATRAWLERFDPPAGDAS